MGPAAGGAVYSPAITDFTLMVDGTSHMFITGPDVIKTVTGEDVTFEELGGAHAHATRSGVAHYQASDEQDCIEFAKLLLSYLPSNNLDEPPAVPADPGLRDHRRRRGARHPDPRLPEPALRHPPGHRDGAGRGLLLRDPRRSSRSNIVTGFGRVAGFPVGVVANQPLHLAGCLDIDASREGRPVRPHLRRLLRPRADLRRRARVPARRRPGMRRHHPPRRQAAVRLRRGHRPQGHRHHPQGLRRRLRRHGLQAPRRRRQPRLAHRPDRRHGRRRRRQHPLPPRTGGRRRPGTPAERTHRRSTRTPSPTPTPPPSAATSTPSSAPPKPAPPSPAP